MIDVRRVATEYRRVMWILVAAFVANVALYAFVVRPMAERVDREEQLAGGAIRDLNAARRSLQAARGTITGKERAEEELQQFYSDVLPPDQSGARRVLYPHVDQLARAAKLRIDGSRFNPEPDRGAQLRKLTMTVNVAGEYTNIRRFIHDLETAPEFLVLESVSVSQGQAGRELNVTANVATYYRAGGDGS